MFGKIKLVGIEKITCTGWSKKSFMSESKKPKVRLSDEPVEAIVKAYSNGETKIICPYSKSLNAKTQYCSCGAEKGNATDHALHPMDNICPYISRE